MKNSKPQLALIEKEINRLITEIYHHNHLYYTLDQPEIPDAQYDLLVQELKRLEKTYPQFKFPFSPTNKVGGEVLPGFEKQTHSYPMLSLDNAFSFTELEAFFERAQKHLPDESFTFVCEPKIDGVGISVSYDEEGNFKSAVTRGNGEVGEVVSANVKTIKNLPLKIKLNQPLEVRGEIFFVTKEFEQFNQQQKIPFKNARNAAAGSIRHLDSTKISNRPLQVCFYHLLNPLQYQLKTQTEVLSFLKKLTLPVSIYNQSVANLTGVQKYLQNLEKNKSTIPYQIDGAVIKIDQLKYWDILGNTNKFPRWGTAYKFPNKMSITKLLDITAHTGRTGKITLVASLVPINIQGSIIKSATLHNFDYVNKNDIQINDYVYLHKAGDVIPKIIAPVLSKRPADVIKYQLPTTCPSCAKPLSKDPDLVDYFCLNYNCPARIINNLIHFTSKQGLDITHLGNQVIETFYNQHIITNIEDIFTLSSKEEEILKLPKFRTKSFNNIISAIEKAKKDATLHQVLSALAILHLGAKSCKILATHFATIEDLQAASLEEILAIKNIGSKIACSVYNFFQEPSNVNLLLHLKNAGVSFANPLFNLDKQPLSLQDQKFVFTGSLNEPRQKYTSAIEKLGGKVTSQISKQTKYLVVGENPGSKLQQAKQLSVEIIQEDQLKNLLK